MGLEDIAFLSPQLVLSLAILYTLFLREETIGDEITIRMYPDEVNEPVAGFL